MALTALSSLHSLVTKHGLGLVLALLSGHTGSKAIVTETHTVDSSAKLAQPEGIRVIQKSSGGGVPGWPRYLSVQIRLRSGSHSF